MATEFTKNFYHMELLADEDMATLFADNKTPVPGIYIMPNRTNTNWFHLAITHASAMTFLRGDAHVLFAFGEYYGKVLEDHKHVGFFVRTKREQLAGPKENNKE